jgi:hypothetical protein
MKSNWKALVLITLLMPIAGGGGHSGGSHGGGRGGEHFGGRGDWGNRGGGVWIDTSYGEQPWDIEEPYSNDYDDDND